MKLELASLRVKNCGPLRDVCIHFDRDGKVQPVTVLAGANGCGKTTALELIYAMARVASGFVRSSFEHQIILKRTEFVVMDCLFDSTPVSMVYGDFVLRPGDYLYFRRQAGDGLSIGSQGSSSESMINLMRKQSDLVLPLQEAQSMKSQGGTLPSVLYFPHTRFLQTVRGQQLEREDTPYTFAHRYRNVESYSGSLDSYFCWLEWTEPELLRRLFRFLEDLDIAGKSFSVDRKALKAVVHTCDGGAHYLEELSSGEQNLLIMLLELRRRLLPGSIVLIDEIENSLHPAFQHRLAQSLLKLQQMVPFQLIVTTHAPAFVEIFGPENTRIMTEF